MKISDIMESASAGASSAGSIAVVAQPLGATLSRKGVVGTAAKYSADATPMTPQEIKRYKNHAVGRFENSIGQ